MTHPSRTPSPWLAALLLVALLLVAALPSHGQPVRFREATTESGLHSLHHDAIPVPPLFDGQNTRFGVGAAILDYDLDGDPDVYAVDSLGWPNRLFRNDGHGRFTDVTLAAGDVGSTAYSHMALAVDLDSDGDPDLVVINDSAPGDNRFPGSQLLRNEGDGTFTDATPDSGFVLHDPTWGGATAGDSDGDGDLDLFVAGWYDRAAYLFENLGGFLFRDRTDEAGVRPDPPRSHWTPVFADLDGDGLQDLFCAVDFDEDVLFRNDGDGTFTDISQEAGTLHEGNDMGVAVFDFQDDGDLDLYTTNVTGPEECELPGGCNVLYVNDGRGRFVDRGPDAGLGDTRWGWGVSAFDPDLDGDRDLLVVNGWEQKQWLTPATLFIDVGGRFVEAAAAAGIDHVGDSRSLVVFDADLDGDPDVLMSDVLGPFRYYENVTSRRGHAGLALELVTGASPPGGVGARVAVAASGRRQMQEIVVGGSFYAGPPLEARFGLGPSPRVDAVQVDFPAGARLRLLDLPSDHRLLVFEPTASVD